MSPEYAVVCAAIKSINIVFVTAKHAAIDAGIVAMEAVIAITSAQSALKAGGTASLTFNLSETSTDFVASDVTVSGGTLSGFTGSGTSYSATFTPTANSTTNGVVSVASGTFKDAAGNNNNDGADANNTKTFTVDTVLPTIAITSSQSALKAGETASLAFTLSETATDFISADVTATGGTLSNFAGSGTSYTATFTPTGLLMPVASMSMRLRIGGTHTLVKPGTCTTRSSSSMSNWCHGRSARALPLKARTPSKPRKNAAKRIANTAGPYPWGSNVSEAAA